MFNVGFFGKNSINWWIGQVPSGQTDNKLHPQKWGDRVKVRIVGYHPAEPILPDADLPWAIMLKPTSQGNGNKGSTGIVGGEWVMGFFLDDEYQHPIIVGVLGRSNPTTDISAAQQVSQQSTFFKNVNIFPSTNPASAWNYKSEEKPPMGQISPKIPPMDAFKQATGAI